MGKHTELKSNSTFNFFAPPPNSHIGSLKISQITYMEIQTQYGKVPTNFRLNRANLVFVHRIV